MIANAFIIGTLGELILVELFVFYIWIKVLFEAVRKREPSIGHKKLLITSVGLVLNAAAIAGIIGIRIMQLLNHEWPFIWEVTIFYVMLALGGFMFIVSAAIGTNARLLRLFLIATAIWTTFIAYLSI